MKIYKLPQLAEISPNAEYFLGPEDIKTKALYLFYGRLRPREAGRKVAPKDGHEEIIFVLKGSIKVRSGKSAFSVEAGEAFHCLDADGMIFDNPGEDEAIFLAAGGRPLESGEASISEPEKSLLADDEEVEIPAGPEEEEFQITKEDA